MGKKKRNGKKGKGRKGPSPKAKLIKELRPEEAHKVLETLHREGGTITNRIEEVAWEELSKLDQDGIVEMITKGLFDLQIYEVYNNSGEMYDHFIAPYEYAEKMIDRVLQPFIFRLKRYQRLSMPEQARDCCICILEGIYNYIEYGPEDEFKDLVDEAPLEYFRQVLETWMKRERSRIKREEMIDLVIKTIPDSEDWIG